MRTILIFGAGYTGLEIARQFDGEVIGTTRNRAQELRENGVAPVDIDDRMAIEDAIKVADLIVLSAPPPDPAWLYRDQIAKSQASIAYLSTTGVYGDHKGGEVTEETPSTPSSKRGEARARTERQWREVAPNLNIYRLGGIYGAGRSPVDKILADTARKIVKPGQRFNRIHVEDIARIVLASFAQGDLSEIYNVVDDLPSSSDEVLDYAAAIMGREPIEPMDYHTSDLSPMTRSFYSENKIVRNDKIRSAFGPMRYPSYREGLDAIWQQLSKKQD